MNVQLQHQGKQYSASLAKPIDISMVLSNDIDRVNCFHAPPFEAQPLVAGDFIGDTRKGSPVNFYNVFFNPHGNGTHTECVGHIAKARFYINDSLKDFHFVATLISIQATTIENGDQVIQIEDIKAVVSSIHTKALIIRTLPNQQSKKSTNYSGTNPTYVSKEAMQWIVDQAVDHLLIDLPSVDREEDKGLLLAHHAFWKYPEETRTKATITELIFVPDEVKDGLYLLNLQIASFKLDASPSKPVLYPLTLAH